MTCHEFEQLSTLAQNAYLAGYDWGWDDAVACCFGGCSRPHPQFDAAEEEYACLRGVDDGRAELYAREAA